MQSRLNIGLKWDQLLSMKCNHEFYADGTGNDFEFIPTNKTSVIFKNFKLYFKQINNGFHIFCNREQFERIHPLKRVTDQKLTFLIKNKNNYLANYTNINFNHFEEVFHFTNIDVNNKKGKVLLHEDDYCIDRGKLKIYSPFQVVKFKSLQKNAKLMDSRGNEIPKEGWYQEKHDMHVLSLRNLQQGKYTFQNGKIEEEFYVIDYIKEPVWGILDIHLYNLPKAADFIPKEEISPIVYNINFQSRSTYWKYFIIGQNKELKLQLNEAKVSYNGEAVEITKPKKVVLANGIEAFSIETKKPMEMKELLHVTDKLELQLKKGNKWQNKTYKVPKPTVKNLKPDKETNKVYSTTYIYV